MGLQVFKSSTAASVVRSPWSMVRAQSLCALRTPHSALLMASLLILASLTGSAYAQDAPRLTDSSEVSLITILPGDPLYSSFGHTAIRIRDDSTGIDVGYNFGTFDFDEPNFYLKFLEGKLNYVLARNLFDDVFVAYQTERRPIIEQRLNFDLAQRQDLFDRLEVNYLPENRAYRYKFLYDNCSTRPRDVIDAAWGYKIEGTDLGQEETFRNLIDLYVTDKPWTRLGIDIILGMPVDVVASPRARMFLPDELLRGVDDARTPDGLRLAQPPDTLYWAPGYIRWGNPWPWPAIVGWFLLVVVTGLSFFETRPGRVQEILRVFDAVLFLLLGIAGIIIALLWFATEHTVTKSNWNLIWALPTHAVLGVALLVNKKPAWLESYLWLTVGLLAITMGGWVWIPQEMNPWLIPFLGTALIRAAARIRTASK